MEETMKRFIIFVFIIGLTVSTAQPASAENHKKATVTQMTDEQILKNARYNVKNRLDTSQISDVETGLKIFRAAIGKLSSNGRLRLDATTLQKAENDYANGLLDIALLRYDLLFEKALVH
ncbi:MAG: hypothetical protein HGA33_03310 [Candidatus Moranbacteria bacterium]|nr:hypothetical protein [Candidatus Moranbacteria bacterium]